jgi:pilus assembly protein CpaF
MMKLLQGSLDPLLLSMEDQLHDELTIELEREADAEVGHPLPSREDLAQRVTRLIAGHDRILTRSQEEALTESVLNRVLGLGPLEPLLADATITEIMVNDPDTIFIERGGQIERIEVTFRDESHLRHVIDRIVGPIGRRIDESSPLVDARLPDGSRVNAIIPPLALGGPVLTIRKFSPQPFTLERLVELGTLDQEMAEFLARCVQERLSIIISGGTGAGKTSTLNALGLCIPEGERLITIEDSAELQLRHPHLVSLESKPPNIEGKGEITIRTLVRNALRMRPDRIIVGEVRGGEAFDMLQAMNTGHRGSLTTLHANSPEDALVRLESMVLMAGFDMPISAIQRMIGGAIQILVQQDRLANGQRVITAVTELARRDDGRFALVQHFGYQTRAGLHGGRSAQAREEGRP